MIIIHSHSGFSIDLISETLEMKGTPTEQWETWLQEHNPNLDNLSERCMEKQVLPQLVRDGFAAPSRRNLRGMAERSLAPMTLYSFAHFLNLLWQPVIQHIEAISSDRSASEPKGLQNNKAALIAEMSGIVPRAEEPMPFDEWVQFIRDTLMRLLHLDVPVRLIAQVTSVVAPLDLYTTPANAMHLLRSSLCSKLVGPALAVQVSRMILAEVAELPGTSCHRKS